MKIANEIDADCQQTIHFHRNISTSNINVLHLTDTLSSDQTNPIEQSVSSSPEIARNC